MIVGLMRMIFCLVAATVGLALTGSTAGASATAIDACAFDKRGNELGCWEDAALCQNLDAWRAGKFVYAREGLHGTFRRGVRLRSGVWQIGRNPPLGRAVAMNSAQWRWRITNRRGSLVANVIGTDGPLMGLVLLNWGTDVFC